MSVIRSLITLAPLALASLGSMARTSRASDWEDNVRASKLLLWAQRPEAVHRPAVRRIRATTWTEVWRVPAGRGHAVVDPVRLATSAGLVFVTDATTERVVAFDAHDGVLRWAFGDEPVDGQRLGIPSDVAVMPSGDVAVADPSNKRIIVLTAAGHARRAIAEVSPTIHSMCVLGDSSFLINILNPASPLVHLGQNGDMQTVIASPWKGLTRPQEIQGLMQRSVNGERCSYILQAGTGFSTVDGKAFGPTAAYIETAETAANRMTGVSAVASAKTLAVLFGGETGKRFRMLDLYELSSFAYRESVVLPEKAIALAQYHGLLIAIEAKDGKYALVAWRPSQGLSTILR